MPENIKFDTPSDEFGHPPEQSEGIDFTGKLIKWGFVSNRTEAQYALVGVAVVLLVIAYFSYHSLSGGSTPPLLP